MLLYILFFVIALSIDAIGMGIALGTTKAKIPIFSLVVITLVTIIYSAIAQLIGKYVFLNIFKEASPYIGFIMIFTLGLIMIIKPLKNRNKDIDLEKSQQLLINMPAGDLDKSGTIDAKEAFFISTAISMDAFSALLGSSLSNMYSIFIPVLIGLFQLIFLIGGLFLGNKILKNSRWNSTLTSCIPGIILILLSISKLIK